VAAGADPDAPGIPAYPDAPAIPGGQSQETPLHSRPGAHRPGPGSARKRTPPQRGADHDRLQGRLRRRPPRRRRPPPSGRGGHQLARLEQPNPARRGPLRRRRRPGGLAGSQRRPAGSHPVIQTGTAEACRARMPALLPCCTAWPWRRRPRPGARSRHAPTRRSTH
jgi:hypothetical protein